MAIAYCDSDGGHKVHWRATRGARIAGRMCPWHGTPLHGKRLGSPVGAMVTCIACRRPRRDSGGNVVHPDVEFVIPEDSRRLHVLQEARVIYLEPGPHPAGSPLCAWHRWRPAEVSA